MAGDDIDDVAGCVLSGDDDDGDDDDDDDDGDKEDNDCRWRWWVGERLRRWFWR